MIQKTRGTKKQAKYKTEIQEEIFENYNQFNQKEYLKFKKIELSKKQKELYEIIRKNKIVVATGPAGTSKTFTACYTALKLFTENVCEKIIICKPTEIIGDSPLGYLKGTLEDKILVYKDSFLSIFKEIIFDRDIKNLTESQLIEFKPVQFMRGSTFKDSIVIIDEFQSFDIKELMAIVTRLGKNTKMVFIGDVYQSDINKKYVAVNNFKEILDGIKDIEMFEFERKDIVREAILIEITDRYEKFKDMNSLPQTKGNT